MFAIARLVIVGGAMRTLPLIISIKSAIDRHDTARAIVSASNAIGKLLYRCHIITWQPNLWQYV